MYPRITPIPTQLPVRETYFIKPCSKDPRLDCFLTPYKLVNTCRSYPEQYLIYKDDNLVGAGIVVNNEFLIESTGELKKILYKSFLNNAKTNYDSFVDDEQRLTQLKNAVNSLDDYYLSKSV